MVIASLIQTALLQMTDLQNIVATSNGSTRQFDKGLWQLAVAISCGQQKLVGLIGGWCFSNLRW